MTTLYAFLSLFAVFFALLWLACQRDRQDSRRQPPIHQHDDIH